MALLTSVGRANSDLNEAAVGFQSECASTAGGGKRKGRGTEYHSRLGIFLMRMHPLLVQ